MLSKVFWGFSLWDHNFFTFSNAKKKGYYIHTTKKSQKVAGFFDRNSWDHIWSYTHPSCKQTGEHNEKILQNTTKKSQKSQKARDRDYSLFLKIAPRIAIFLKLVFQKAHDNALPSIYKPIKFMVSWSHFLFFTQRLKDFSFLDIFKNVHFQEPSASFF